MVGELSHDLRTPLTSMTTFFQLLQGSAILREGLERECIDSLASEVKFLGHLVGHLFELSRIENPQNKIEVSAIDLPSLLRAIENQYSLSTIGRSVRFTGSIATSVVPLLGDKTLFRRAPSFAFFIRVRKRDAKRKKQKNILVCSTLEQEKIFRDISDKYRALESP